jgi:hypothetical protein
MELLRLAGFPPRKRATCGFAVRVRSFQVYRRQPLPWDYFRFARQEEFRNSPELFRDLAFSVWNLRLPQFDRIPLRVMQASEPAVGIRLRVNLDRDSRSF